MTNWNMMFEGVQKIIWSSTSMQAGIEKVIAFAKQHPQEYSDPQFWERVSSSQFPIEIIRQWAYEGFQNLQPCSDWTLIRLDAGDGPDIFRMIEVQPAPHLEDDVLGDFIKGSVVREAGEFPEIGLASHTEYILSDHNVDELSDPVLNWKQSRPPYDYHGNNGYLLWLTIASLALCLPLQDQAYCINILKGRPRLLLMSGFEEIFFWAGEITQEGFKPL